MGLRISISDPYRHSGLSKNGTLIQQHGILNEDKHDQLGDFDDTFRESSDGPFQHPHCRVSHQDDHDSGVSPNQQEFTTRWLKYKDLLVRTLV